MMKKILVAILCLSLFITATVPVGADWGVGTHDYMNKEDLN